MDENKTKLDEFNEAICEAKTNWLSKLGIVFLKYNILCSNIYIYYSSFLYTTINNYN